MKSIIITDKISLNNVFGIETCFSDSFSLKQFSRPGYTPRKQFYAVYSRARSERRWPNSTKAMFAPMPKKAI
jgi:hypothetical protein